MFKLINSKDTTYQSPDAPNPERIMYVDTYDNIRPVRELNQLYIENEWYTYVVQLKDRKAYRNVLTLLDENYRKDRVFDLTQWQARRVLYLDDHGDLRVIDEAKLGEVNLSVEHDGDCIGIEYKDEDGIEYKDEDHKLEKRVLELGDVFKESIADSIRDNTEPFQYGVVDLTQYQPKELRDDN
jgi:hypothetical protein